MRSGRALRHRSSVRCLKTFHSIFAVILPLARPKSWYAQLAVSNDPRYAPLEANFGDSAGQGSIVIAQRQSCDTLAM
ncbi:hypothetical protein TNCV_3015521 [Trichonephila clavipes]|nr:hypothetical protein TNCV_3015521 [Trichonephila clavipes]